MFSFYFCHYALTFLAVFSLVLKTHHIHIWKRLRKILGKRKMILQSSIDSCVKTQPPMVKGITWTELTTTKSELYFQCFTFPATSQAQA